MPPKDWNELTLVQNPAIQLLKDNLNYGHLPGEAVRADYQANIILENTLKESLKRINPFLDEININKAIRRLTNPEDRGTSLIEINRELHSDLVGGISLLQDLGSGRKNETVRYIDFENIENNDFLVVDEFKVKGHENCRADLVIFINGIPLIVIECKSPKLSSPIFDAVNQLRRYQNIRTELGKEGCERLFYTNLLCVALAREEARYGSILASEKHYGVWKDPWPKTVEELGSSISQDILLHSIFEKSRLLDILQNFIVFEQEGNKIIKKICRYQQYRAVGKTFKQLQNRNGGVIWHTQGSGKSLTMVYLGLKLKRELNNPSLVYVTDRIDLDQQLHGTFTRCGFPNPVNADSCRDLREQLSQKKGITILTTIHKFGEGVEEFPLSEDENIFVLVDEAHRSQYKGLAAQMRKALPNAVLVGFTGTPIDKNDKSTPKVFGSYIDQYGIQQAVDDQATVPIYYEARLAEVRIDGKSLDDLFEMYFRDYSEEEKAAIKQKHGTEKAIMQSSKRIEMICMDIIKHYESTVQPDGFKAQIVANGRDAALIFKKCLDRLNGPKSALIMSIKPDDSEKMKRTAIAKDDIKAIVEDQFKTPFDKGGKIAIIIVTDMLLTGFDAPIEQVMYIDKPLQEHSLLQAIARCNRTYPGKGHGLIVDYYGLSTNLKKALAVFDPIDVRNVAQPTQDLLPILEAKHNACLQFFKNLDDLEECIEKLSPDDTRARFKRVFKEFSRALNNVLPSPEGLRFNPDLKKLSIIYLEATRKYERTDISHIKGVGEKVKKLIDEHVLAHGINNLTEPLPLFSDKFMESLEGNKSDKAKASEMEHSLKHVIRTSWDKDPVYWNSLQEKLNAIIKEYEAKRLDELLFLEELTRIREEAVSKHKNDQKHGFNFEAESAIWNTLEANEELKTMAIDIYQSISDLVVIDWENKEDVVKGMRKTIKRKLRENNIESIEEKTGAIINLLKTHGKKPEVWQDYNPIQNIQEAAEEGQNYGTS